MKVIHKRLVDCLRQKKSVALATIIETEGSTPQVTGASAIFSTRGLLAGTIGGGLLEAEIEKKSLQALKRQTSCLCRFSLNAEMAEDGAICGGAVTVLIDACPAEQATTFRHLKRSLEQRQPGMLATGINFITERDVSMYRLWIKKEAAAAAPSDQRLAACEKEIRNVFAANKPALLNIQEGKRGRQRQKSLLFLQPLSPQPQLVIVGAGHIGQAIAHLGSRLDFHVTLIDDRPEYANRKRAPEADRIIVADIGRSLRILPSRPIPISLS